eukprot:symbB.v1.2.017628.t1/scaffold1340.1/size241236/13
MVHVDWSTLTALWIVDCGGAWKWTYPTHRVTPSPQCSDPRRTSRGGFQRSNRFSYDCYGHFRHDMAEKVDLAPQWATKSGKSKSARLRQSLQDAEERCPRLLSLGGREGPGQQINGDYELLQEVRPNGRPCWLRLNPGVHWMKETWLWPVQLRSRKAPIDAEWRWPTRARWGSEAPLLVLWRDGLLDHCRIGTGCWSACHSEKRSRFLRCHTRRVSNAMDSLCLREGSCPKQLPCRFTSDK